MLYLQKTYKLYRIENPEIKNYTLILSGKDVPFIKYGENDNEEKFGINDKRISIKNKLLNELNVKDADINFTFKLSEYYEKWKNSLNCKPTNICFNIKSIEKSVAATDVVVFAVNAFAVVVVGKPY